MGRDASHLIMLLRAPSKRKHSTWTRLLSPAKALLDVQFQSWGTLSYIQLQKGKKKKIW